MAVTITKQDILNANTYMPLGMKTQLARQIAQWCMEEEPGEAGTPSIWRESRARRQLFFYGLFGRFYLKKDFACGTVEYIEDGETKETEIDYFMTVAEYDEWAGSHVMNQLERLKRDKEISDRIYDLLYDLKALEGTIYGAVRDELEKRNDPVKRLSMMVAAETGTAYLKSNLAEINDLARRMEKEKAGGDNE